MKKYVFSVFKRNIPIFAISLAIITSIFLTLFTSSPLSITTSMNTPIVPEYTEVEITYMVTIAIVSFIPMIIFTWILPIFANTNRYSIRSADLFYQRANKRNVRFITNLVILIGFLACFTFAFIIGSLLFSLKYIPNLSREAKIISEGSYYKITYYPVYQFYYLIPLYLALVISGINNYFVSYFLVTRANNALNSIILLVLGHLILGLGIIMPFFIVDMFGYGVAPETYRPLIDSSILGGTRSASMIGVTSLVVALFPSLIVTGKLPDIDFSGVSGAFSLTMSILSLLLFFAVGVLGVLYFLKEKDSSGEFAGKAVGRDKFQNIIFYVGATLIGFAFSTLYTATGYTSSFVITFAFISEVIMFCALLYVFTGLINRNFRLNKKQVITMLIIDAAVLIYGLVSISIMTGLRVA